MRLKELDLYITEYCNLNCPFCSICAGVNNHNILSYNQIISIVNQAIELGLEEIHITGGEPTLHPDFMRIMKYVLDKNIGVRLITNGTTLDECILQELRHEGLTNIMISLDGTEEFHKIVRGNGNFSKTLDCVKLARNLGYKVRVNSVAWKENSESICSLIPLLNDLGVEIYSIFLGSPVGRAKVNQSLTSFNPWEWREFIHKLSKCISSKSRMQLVIEKAFVFSDENEENQFNKLRGCQGLENRHEYISIRASGDIYPCVFFSNNDDFSFGNIKTHKISDILKNSQKINIYNKISCIPDECSSCISKDLCYGGCKGYSNYLDDKVYKDPRCTDGISFYPVCPLIKMDLTSKEYAACTDDLIR